MGLSSADKAFIEKRERRVKYWPLFGAALLATVSAYVAWLWLRMPHMVNPWFVIESLEAGTLPESTIGIMAVMLPVVMAVLLVFAIAVVLLWFVSFYNERRLIRLVRKLEADSE